jgi:hypothetical protein
MNKIRYGKTRHEEAIKSIIEKVNEVVERVNALTGEQEDIPSSACKVCYGAIGSGICRQCGREFGV